MLKNGTGARAGELEEEDEEEEADSSIFYARRSEAFLEAPVSWPGFWVVLGFLVSLVVLLIIIPTASF